MPVLASEISPPYESAGSPNAGGGGGSVPSIRKLGEWASGGAAGGAPNDGEVSPYCGGGGGRSWDGDVGLKEGAAS
jgi:hypothetical protein